MPLPEMAVTTKMSKGANQSTDASLYLIVSQRAPQSSGILLTDVNSPKTMSYTSKILYATQDPSSRGSYILTTSTNTALYWNRRSYLSGLACNYHVPTSSGRCTWS